MSEDRRAKRKRSSRRTVSPTAAPAAATPASDPSAPRGPAVPRFLADAPRQPRTLDAWQQFAARLAEALRGLEPDEWLVLSLPRRNRFVQFMNQGSAGFRAEAVSDFYLADDDHLSEDDRQRLLELGWDAPTNLPDEFGHLPDGSPNYFLDLAPPVPLDELALLAVNTLLGVHGAEHPGALRYSTGSEDNASIRFPGLGIRRARDGK